MLINFNRDWNRGDIRKLVNDNCYLYFGVHEDLKALCVNEEDFESDTRDYIEMTFVVPKRWLNEICKKHFGIEDVDYWLQNEYTSDDSEAVFSLALSERKVVMIDFNT